MCIYIEEYTVVFLVRAVLCQTTSLQRCSFATAGRMFCHEIRGRNLNDMSRANDIRSCEQLFSCEYL